MVVDRKFRRARLWSNVELRKFASKFGGDVVNVSGWRDEDKEGGVYEQYFSLAKTYYVTNYKSEARGFQGDREKEIFLDLTQPCPLELVEKFDVIFNHTVLEHVFEVDQAFTNLCLMSRDLVVVVVPFIQEQHADYGDFWRFTPQAVDRLFKKNGLETIYLSYNDESDASIYIFAIGSKKPYSWPVIKADEGNRVDFIYKDFVGLKLFLPTFFERVVMKLKKII